MRHEAAIRRIESFGKRFGPSRSHLYLAYHAAFPLALTPDLLYRIWANFQRDCLGKYLNIPWIAVADILLSNLCDDVGHELYEMDVAVRNELLKQLKEDSHFGKKRINELSNFLLAYVPILRTVFKRPEYHRTGVQESWGDLKSNLGLNLTYQ
ncbi:hypothetical protein BCD67_03285 [Oscillatoriales cyanobacterium USR001]|nr:hypothetical protein BCD67_03285 [Oscillatoriales cyanobacterium USR001]